MNDLKDSWASGNAYDVFIGRWSRLVAKEFIRWLEPPTGLRWLELGCGTGALTSALIELTAPTSVLAGDPSESLLSLARKHIVDPRVTFVAASSGNYPPPTDPFDACVFGLVLNFIPDPQSAIESIMPFLAPGGIVGGYVWDYTAGMEFLRVFWDAASAINPAAIDLDEAKRFPLCAPGPLRSLFLSAGLNNVQVKPIGIRTRFVSFMDYWEPFLGGTGPAPSYVTSLAPEARQQLMENLRARLLPGGDGSFELAARAWAAQGSSSTGQR